MSNSIYRECPGCASSVRRSKGRKNGFEIFDCQYCRTVYTGSLPTPEDAEDYDEYYSEANLSVPPFVADRVSEIVAGFGSLRRENRLLDVGFGAGTILESSSEQGWDAFGLEVSKPAVEKARQAGFKVFHGRLREAKYPNDYFDIVTASEILEHMDSPKEDLKEIFRILRPGGMFWGTTPSCQGLSARVLGTSWSILSPPEHTQLYSRKGLKLMFHDAGFTSIRLKTHGTNPMEILNYYKRSSAQNTQFNRVETAYALNESMTKNSMRKALKRAINTLLDLSGLGDSFKIYARKPL